MNYEQARQIGPDGPAPGKWNWTNYNDSVAARPYTAAPCLFPDSPIPDDWVPGTPVPPRDGRERCDHDTQEDAERHRYEYERSNVQFEALNLDTAAERRRCIVCDDWETHRTRAYWPIADGESFCTVHATPDGWREAHPFRPGMTHIHS